MTSVKAVAAVIVLSIALTAGLHLTLSRSMGSPAAKAPPPGDKSQHDRQLCERLIRFGQEAFDRGRMSEAKHFFQKAIAVDPTHATAWKKYNTALLALVSARLENDPGFLPEFSSGAGGVGPAPARKSTDISEEDDGC